MGRNSIWTGALIVVAAVVMVGCSSAGSNAGAPGSSQPAAASQAPAASVPAASVPAASAPGAPSQAAGGTGGGVCDLVTADELKGILGVAVTTTVIAGPPDNCKVDANGATVVALVLTPSGGAGVFSAFAGGGGATSISGMGDKAAYAPSQGLLVILKGDKLLSMSAYDPSKTEEQRLEQMKKIGAIAAGRM